MFQNNECATLDKSDIRQSFDTPKNLWLLFSIDQGFPNDLSPPQNRELVRVQIHERLKRDDYDSPDR